MANNGETEVFVDGKFIGTVYKSTHGVWVADPLFNMFSCSFSSQEEATKELVTFYTESMSLVDYLLS